MKKNPRVSVIMAVYNGGQYLKESINSVLNQTFSDFEFIIINDGSTDNTSKVLDSFNDPRIIRLKNEKNIGLVKSLNRGISVARGEFIARIDADDMSHLDRFQKQMDFLKNHPEVGVLGTAIENIDASGHRLSISSQPENHELILWKMIFECAIIHPTVMMRKAVIVKVGGYNEKFAQIEDAELWGRLAAVTHFANLKDILHVRRMHRRSKSELESGSKTQSQERYQAEIVIRQKLFDYLLGKPISRDAVRWFSRPETVLSPAQIKEIISLLIELYARFVRISIPDEKIAVSLRADLVNKIVLVSHGDDKVAFKKAVKYLKTILPGPLRHKMRMSKIGGYFDKYLGRL